MVTSLVRPIRLRSAEGAEEGRKVTWLELFFDLAFVAAVSQVGASLTDHYSGDGLIRYALLLFLIWWAWLGHTLYSTRFDTDDFVQRLLTFAQIFGVAVMAINADEGLDSRSSAGFAAAYAGMRMILVIEYLRPRRVARVRTFASWTAASVAVTAVVWLISALVPAPFRYWCWGLALVMEIAIPLAIGHFRSDVPLDPAHLPERFGLFTIILLGESLVSVMRGMKTQETWSVAAASSALFGLAMAFTIWWWYFDGVEAAGERHVHSHVDSRLLYFWAYAHLPLYLGIGVAGVGMEHVIKFAPTHPLASTEAWMLCGGLAMAMAAVTTIAAARPRRHERALSTRRIAAHACLVAVTLGVGVAASQVHAAVVLLTLVVLAIGQLVVSLRLVTVPRRRIAVVAS